MATKPLSHNDIMQLLASALKIDRYQIEDVFDSSVVYRNSSETPTGYYQADYAIDKDGKVTTGTPVKVMRRTTYEPMVKPATFSIEGPAKSDGDFVTRTGKLFEAGEYPDKKFSLTESEMDAAVAAFTPVKNNLEHVNTVLDGKVGKIQHVERRGKELFGTVQIPKWLDTIIGKDPLKVSLEWARNTKQIIGNALVINPRVPDAQLVAAFTAANNLPHKEKPMPLLDRIKALFSNKDKEPTEDELKAVFTEETPPEKKPVEKPEEKTEEKPPEKPADTKPAGFSAEAVAGLQRSLLNVQAEAWFNQELAAGHVFPAQKDSLVAMFCQAAQADAGTTVCFSADGTLAEGPLLKALKASVAAYPQHHLTSEQLKGDVVIMSNTPKQQADAERMKALRATYGLKQAE